MDFIISIIIFSFVTSFSPGPNNMMLMASGVNYGINKSIPHLMGIFIGFPFMLVAVAFGLAGILYQYPSIYLMIKITGILYLIFLAWKIATTPTSTGNTEQTAKDKGPLTFAQAALFQWVNPKAWVIAIGAIASFTTSSNFNYQVILIVFSYAIVGGASMFAWLYIGVVIKRWLNSASKQKIFNLTMAGLLVTSILPMAVSELTAFDKVLLVKNGRLICHFS